MNDCLNGGPRCFHFSQQGDVGHGREVVHVVPLDSCQLEVLRCLVLLEVVVDCVGKCQQVEVPTCWHHRCLPMIDLSPTGTGALTFPRFVTVAQLSMVGGGGGEGGSGPVASFSFRFFPPWWLLLVMLLFFSLLLLWLLVLLVFGRGGALSVASRGGLSVPVGGVGFDFGPRFRCRPFSSGRWCGCGWSWR